MRLTNYHRRSILKKTIAATHDGKDAAILLRENAFADEVYDIAYPILTRAGLVDIDTSWLHTSHTIRVNAGGYDLILRFAAPRVVKNDHTGKRFDLTDTDLIDRLQKFSQERETAKTNRRSAEHQLDKMLDSFKTLASLANAWPEGAPFYREISPRPATIYPVPAARIEEINKVLGLPIDEVEAA